MSLVALFLTALLGVTPWPAADPPPRTEPDGSLTVELRPSGPGRALPGVRVLGPPGRPLVVLDPGHGGHDPGATSPINGRREKDVALDIARAVQDELLRSRRVRVALTRSDDRYILHADRYGIAQRLGAGLFISIHADAAPANDAARGATIYTLSEVASDRQAALLAQTQNAASGLEDGQRLHPNAAVNRILIDLAQRESMDASADFARLLKREASAFFPFRPDYHRFASLLVLKAPDIPSILFESGYLTNPEDAAYIQSPQGREQIATGIRRAVEAHFARRLARTER
jgi:N-acetylmuramoyl-L-alanine amidase